MYEKCRGKIIINTWTIYNKNIKFIIEFAIFLQKMFESENSPFTIKSTSNIER